MLLAKKSIELLTLCLLWNGYQSFVTVSKFRRHGNTIRKEVSVLHFHCFAILLGFIIFVITAHYITLAARTLWPGLWEGQPQLIYNLLAEVARSSFKISWFFVKSLIPSILTRFPRSLD